MTQSKMQRLERRCDYLRGRLAHGHYSKSVMTKWRNDLVRTQAMILALQDGKSAGDWTNYKHKLEV